MKNKSTFIFITVLMSLLVIYALITNVILPVVSQNKLAVENISKGDEQTTPKKKKATNKETAVKEENIPDSLKKDNRHQAREEVI